MLKKNTAATLLGLVVFMIFLTGCAAPTPALVQPTVDQDMLDTAVAQTVVVKTTLLAALNPSATPEGQSAKPARAAAQAATATPTPAIVATDTPSGPTATATIDRSLYPTKTPRRIPDAAAILSFSPPDGKTFNPGNQFDAVWKVKNVGSSTWNTAYRVRYASGTRMSETSDFYLDHEVKPGETTDLIADIVTPDEKGLKISYWEFVNANGDIIIRMYVAITVE